MGFDNYVVVVIITVVDGDVIVVLVLVHDVAVDPRNQALKFGQGGDKGSMGGIGT